MQRVKIKHDSKHAHYNRYTLKFIALHGSAAILLVKRPFKPSVLLGLAKQDILAVPSIHGTRSTIRTKNRLMQDYAVPIRSTRTP